MNNQHLNSVQSLETIKFQKPFIKWVGGKSKLLPSIFKRFPTNIENYHELFLGGGSVLFGVLSLQKQNLIKIHKKIYAYDINRELINLYKHIQQKKDELYECIQTYLKIYDSLDGTIINRKPKDEIEAKTSKESYYYWLRNTFNTMDKNTVEYSALFIFLNKTCFRGVYREGPNGFNVPYGHYKKTPTIITKEELNIISELIQNVEFICNDFENSITNIKENDFVYLDPPYVPIKSDSFVSYNIDGFNLEKHKKLFDNILELNEKNIKFLMSNAKVDLVMNYFKHFKYDEITAKRSIHCKNPASTTTEVIVYN